MPRLRRADCSGPGISRRRHGRGFTYLDADGARIDDPEVLARISELAIPPAWKDVWICSSSLGHLQATGTDAAGRKQYLYHPEWRRRRDVEKFRDLIACAHDLTVAPPAASAASAGRSAPCRTRPTDWPRCARPTSA